MIGRGRALEVLLGANDIDGNLAERNCYVNRALPDAELDPFVDAFARRISTFDEQALAETKQLVNLDSLPAGRRDRARVGRVSCLRAAPRSPSKNKGKWVSLSFPQFGEIGRYPGCDDGVVGGRSDGRRLLDEAVEQEASGL